jgi:hypothetical protein
VKFCIKLAYGLWDTIISCWGELHTPRCVTQVGKALADEPDEVDTVGGSSSGVVNAIQLRQETLSENSGFPGSRVVRKSAPN